MAEQKKPAAKNGKGGKGLEAQLKKKYAGAPLWVWAVAAGVGLYLYYRYKGSGQAAFTSNTTPTTTGTQDQGTGQSGGAGGNTLPGGGGNAAGGFDQSLLDQLNQNITGLSNALANFQPVVGDPFATGASSAAVPSYVAAPGDNMVTGVGTSPTAKSASLAGLVSSLGLHPFQTGIHAVDFASQAAARSTLAQGLGFAAPFGGVVNVHRGANGVTVTTYASGRTVTQAPGRTAYVSAKGGSSSRSSGGSSGGNYRTTQSSGGGQPIGHGGGTIGPQYITHPNAGPVYHPPTGRPFSYL